jgi:hypothetical protein
MKKNLNFSIFSHQYAANNNTNENINVLSIRPHKKSCRGLEFSHDGACMLYFFFLQKNMSNIKNNFF